MKKLNFIVKPLLAVFLCWRLALLIVGVLADRLLLYAPSFPYFESLLPSFGLPRWIYSWANFDGVHYLTLIQSGYVGTGLIQAFFPLFPIFIKILSINSLFNPMLIGLIISNLSFLLLLIVLFALLKKDFSSQLSWRTIIVLLVFPTSFFFGAFYNESIFLLLVVTSFWFAREKHWLAASLIAALASATRLVGVFLWPALILELWLQQKKSTHLKDFVASNWPKIGLISLSIVGLLAFMLYLKLFFNDFLYFLHVQTEFGAGRQESLVLLPQVVWRYLKIMITVRPIDWKFFSYAQDFFLSLFSILLLLLGTKKIRPSYLLFAWPALLLPTLTGTFSSMPRYILVCFPIFLVLAQLLSKNKLAWVLYLTFSLSFLIINTTLFIQGYWIA